MGMLLRRHYEDQERQAAEQAAAREAQEQAVREAAEAEATEKAAAATELARLKAAERNTRFPDVDFASDVAYELARDWRGPGGETLGAADFEGWTGNGKEGAFLTADVRGLLEERAEELTAEAEAASGEAGSGTADEDDEASEQEGD